MCRLSLLYCVFTYSCISRRERKHFFLSYQSFRSLVLIKIKNIFSLKSYLIITSIFFISCSDEFTLLAPESQRNVDNFYQTKTDFETALSGVYVHCKVVELMGISLISPPAVPAVIG